MPILAMTANAFGEDRQRCFDAGMNDHVPKPVDRMYSSRPSSCAGCQPAWRPASGAYPLSTQEITAPPPGDNDTRFVEYLREQAGFDIEAGLRSVRNRIASYRRLAAFSPIRMPAMLPSSRSGFAGHDTEGARRLAHTLKGAAGFAGRDYTAGGSAAPRNPDSRPKDPIVLSRAIAEAEAVTRRTCEADQYGRSAVRHGSGHQASPRTGRSWRRHWPNSRR